MNLTGAVVSLAVAAWLIWLFPAPHLAAVLGIGPVDGVMTITSCYGATDVEGYPDGTDCGGTYTPRAAGGSPRRITLDKAAESHDPGSVREVRTVRGRAHELSGDALGTWVTATLLILGPFLALALWGGGRGGGRAPGAPAPPRGRGFWGGVGAAGARGEV
ncbi:hypothetical protein, partial [[Kitasatospora] papulosa]|uniref:hypothetical protein n=1 Tax=[Kitasatospora] papulosa TaxID=1464011 RepID=UPI0036C6210B